MFFKLIFVLATIFFGWLLYRYIKSHPEAFSKENLNKSFFALGILALFLIAVVTVCVLFLRDF